MACTAAVLVVLLVLLMGCTGGGPDMGPAHGGNSSGGGYSGSSGNGGDTGGGSGNGGSSGTGAGPAKDSGTGGNNGNGGSGNHNGRSGNGGSRGSPGSFSQQTYFSIDCSGTWHANYGNDWSKIHGSFTLEGNIPVLMDYDYHTISPALYTDTNAGNLNKGNLMHLRSEFSEVVDKDGTFIPCHFTYDGYQWAGGSMEYNTSGDSSRRWTAMFDETSKDISLPPEKVEQTDPSCPITDYAKNPPTELTQPADACYTAEGRQAVGSPFSFSDSSTFPVIDTITYSDSYTFDKLDPTATFHMGRAPS